MNKADGQGARDRLTALVANSLDTQAKTQDLARQAYQSRTQFHRLFRTAVEETPAAMRRRLLLERAAYQLGHTAMSVTEVALDANYNSLEAFTRAFRRAFRTSPSIYRRMRDPHFHLPTSNRIHSLAPRSLTEGGTDMDLFDRFAVQRLMAHATFAGIREYFDRGTTGSATAHSRRAAALAGVEQDVAATAGEHYLHERSLDRRAVRDRNGYERPSQIAAFSKSDAAKARKDRCGTASHFGGRPEPIRMG